MKKISHLIFLILFSFIVFSCSSLMDSKTSSITIKLPESSARAALALTPDYYEVEAVCESLSYDEKISTKEQGGSTVTFEDLSEAVYLVSVRAYDSSDSLVSEGTDSVEVKAGETAQANITLKLPSYISVTASIEKNKSPSEALELKEEGIDSINGSFYPQVKLTDFTVFTLSEKTSDSESKELAKWTSSTEMEANPVKLDRGSRTFTLSAENASGLKYTAALEKEILAGNNTQAFELKNSSLGTGNGTISMDFTYPDTKGLEAAAVLYNAATKKETDVTLDVKIADGKGTIAAKEVSAGEYLLFLTFAQTDVTEPLAVYGINVTVGSGLTTSGSLKVTALPDAYVLEVLDFTIGAYYSGSSDTKYKQSGSTPAVIPYTDDDLVFVASVQSADSYKWTINADVLYTETTAVLKINPYKSESLSMEGSNVIKCVITKGGKTKTAAFIFKFSDTGLSE